MRLAVIPARGGSKRIPRKNIRNFADKPIIAYSITAALETNLFDHVVVSTDDEEIADISRQLGAEVPFIRPKELADDFTGTGDVTTHAINWFVSQGHSVDFACCIYATAPFLQAQRLIDGWEKLIESGKDYVFSVTTYPFPIQRSLRMNQRGCMEIVSHEDFQKRSQDLEEMYHDAGQFYWGKAESFGKVDIHGVSLPIVLPRWLVQDIDTEEDWRRAELMYQAMHLSLD